MAKETQVKKAQTVAKALKKTPSTVVRKVRRNVHFFRPKTRQLTKKSMYPQKSNPSLNKMDEFRVIVSPLTTETAMKKVEDSNTLVFLCDVKSTKKQIADAVLSLYNIKADKVNTLIRPDGVKKAFIRLSKDQDALDVANRIGIL
jgi:large subunit ribosomal protein L23Ae